MTEAVISVLIVDDHPVTRDGIAYALLMETDIRVAAECATGMEAIALHRMHQPDVTLMDLRLPDTTGIAAMQQILGTSPGARFIVLTTYAGDIPAKLAYRTGASGYLLKNTLSKDLVATIRKVHAGERVISPEIAATMAEYKMLEELSPREIAVLRLVASGNSNKLVAAQMGVSMETIKGHMKCIMAKLGAGDRTHAVTIAQRRGFFAC